MCGIAGYFDRYNLTDHTVLNRMLTRIKHRGPDECGIYTDLNFGFGSVRLSIIDIATGQQPLPNSNLNLWIAFNGEIFNYIELREDLEEKGHQFRTQSDTEVIVHLYDEYGEDCLNLLNGQFAFAIWDKTKKEVFLARDRVGIRPLYYFYSPELFVFGSEIKAIFEHPKVERQISNQGLDEVFTYWTCISPNTVFRQIKECPPGHFIRIKDGDIKIKKYWQINFAKTNQYFKGSFDEAVSEFNKLFYDSIRIRLRADVPVAAYLSGGLDSSATTAFIKEIEPGILRTFSIGFTENEFDESEYQKLASEYFKTNHRNLKCSFIDIANHFEKVVWHSEMPLLRTAPTPMYILSELVRENSIKVVITGEGADELLGGYNIFKENEIRRFWAKFPNSKIRPLLLKKLYPYVKAFQNANPVMLRMFFAYGLTNTDSPIYSHLLRWKNTSNIKKHFSNTLKKQLKDNDDFSEVIKVLNEDFSDLDSLAKAQYLEILIFLSGYLLSSQGDRMGMANSVEGRYPFLDHRIIEFCATLPPEYKLKGLNEKVLLKKMMNGKMPEQILSRSKQAYRAPILESFLGNKTPGYVTEVLSKKYIEKAGIFNPISVEKLLSKVRSGKAYSEIDNMAITGIISTQLIYKQFISEFRYLRKSEMIKCSIRSESDFKN